MNDQSYFQESIERLCDADRRGRDPFSQWRGEGLTPAAITQLQRETLITRALAKGFASINQTYASFTGEQQ